jgi:hypothetical protein
LNCGKSKNVDPIAVLPAYGLQCVVGRVMASMALAALIVPLGGCWSSAGGGGTVDIARAKAASYTNSNPEMVKAAAARGKGLTGTAQKSRPK